MPEQLHLHLPHHAPSAAAARDAVRTTFGSSLDPGPLADLTLVVSELVANAVRHGQGEVEVRVERCGAVLQGEVIDRGPGFERRLRAASPEELGGRGLPMLSQLARRWGVFDGSSHVWFELAASCSPTPRPQEAELGPPPPGVLPDVD